MNMLIEKHFMVPMRDGVRLATDIYRPAEGGPVPVLLARLPYNKDSLQQAARGAFDPLCAVQAGYAVVLQDCRGRFASEGEFTPMVNEASDGAETVAWIAQQPWSTGHVGTFGGSYLGFTQWHLAREHPEALRAIAPLVSYHLGLLTCALATYWRGLRVRDLPAVVPQHGIRGGAAARPAGEGWRGADGSALADDKPGDSAIRASPAGGYALAARVCSVLFRVAGSPQLR